VLNLLFLIDKANGYSYSGLPSASTITNSVSIKEVDLDYFRIGSIQEKYVANNDDEIDVASELAKFENGSFTS
jgi:hypothetical protein